MKKRIFALALALCMMLSVMPNAFATGILTVDGGSNSTNGILSLDNGTSGRSTTSTPAPTQTRQDGVLYNTGSGSEENVALFGNDNGLLAGLSTGMEQNKAADTVAEAFDGVLDEGEQGSNLTAIGSAAESTGISGVTAAAPKNSVTIALSNENKVERTKSISPNGNGGYTITLNTWTKSTEIETKSAANIVLVLDASETMRGTNATTLENAVNKFLASVLEAPGSKVAIVGYSNAAKQYTGDATNPASALVSIEQMNDDGEIVLDATGKTILNQTLTSATAAVKTDTNNVNNNGKLADTGLELAAAILQDYDAEYKAKLGSLEGAPPSVVVLFTNGIPTTNVDEGSFFDAGVYNIVEETIHWGTILKGSRGTPNITLKDHDFYNSSFNPNNNTGKTTIPETSRIGCGATVYCIGVGLPNETWFCGGHFLESCNSCKANEFLYRTSSAVKDGTHVKPSWNYTIAATSDTNYYKRGDMSALEGIFSSIKVETGVSLDDIAIKDFVPNYMEIVPNSASAYRQGNETINGVISAEKNSVTWAGIDLKPVNSAQNGVTLTFDVQFKDGFLGGNSVPVNTTASGLYGKDKEDNEALIGGFGIPTVNVPATAINPEVRNQNIYLSNEADLTLLIKALHSSIDGDLNKYADVVYTIVSGGKTLTYTVPAGKTVGYWTGTTEVELTADTEYTVTCTVNTGTNSAGTENKVSGTSKPAKVYVYKPEITCKDTTMYLGNKADYSKNHSTNSVEWVGNGDGTYMGDRPKVTVGYSIADDGKTGYFTGCEDIDITSVTLGKNYEAGLEHVTFVNGTSHSGDEEADEFTVHVLKPNVQFQDSTIYLGYVPKNDDFLTHNIKGDTVWNDASGDTSYPAPSGDKPEVTFAFATAEGEDYTDCATISATVSSGGLKSHDGSFTVHVLKPSFSVQDAYIYQGQTKDLTDCIILADSWSADCANENIVGEKPSKNAFVFEVNDKAVADFVEMECTALAVTDASINEKSAIDYFTNKNFTVHVLKPSFIVNTTDLWADYGTEVDLYHATNTDAVVGVQHTWIYTGDCTGDNVHPAELPTGAPEITLNEVTFAEGATYNVGTSDGTVTVNSVKYNSSTAGDQETSTDLIVKKKGEADNTVTIHVNKFDLTINKTWKDGEKDADGTYKQDAIFNLYHVVTDAETGKPVDNLVTQVVLSAKDADGMIVIKGLFCGQDYTVEEDSNWTWRWNSSSEDYTVTKDETKHDVAATDPHGEENGDHDATVSFTNSLKDKIGKLWLSFCTMVANIFQKGGNF